MPSWISARNTWLPVQAAAEGWEIATVPLHDVLLRFAVVGCMCGSWHLCHARKAALPGGQCLQRCGGLGHMFGDGIMLGGSITGGTSWPHDKAVFAHALMSTQLISGPAVRIVCTTPAPSRIILQRRPPSSYAKCKIETSNREVCILANTRKSGPAGDFAQWQ